MEVCIGYFEVARPGDQVTPECIECGQDCSRGIWVAVMADGTIIGPLCDICATSD